MYVGKFGSVEQIQYFYQMTLNNVARVWPLNIILALWCIICQYPTATHQALEHQVKAQYECRITEHNCVF